MMEWSPFLWEYLSVTNPQMEEMWKSQVIPEFGRFLLGWGKVFPSVPEGLERAPGCAPSCWVWAPCCPSHPHPALTNALISRNLGKALMAVRALNGTDQTWDQPFPGTPCRSFCAGFLVDIPHSSALSRAQELQQE